ncbi:MAG: ribosomal-processing cysteine protease Prp [Bacillota bacterium]
MVSVVVRNAKTGEPVGFTCSGHAEYAGKGYDIVCAGISALTHSAVLALERLTNLKLNIEQNNRNGYLECDWFNQKEDSERASVIIQVMLIGLYEIQRQYPDYLKVTEVEV